MSEITPSPTASNTLPNLENPDLDKNLNYTNATTASCTNSFVTPYEMKNDAIV